MTIRSTNWGVVLVAHPFDCEMWLHALPDGADPWIVNVRDDYVLRSAAFNGFEEPAQILSAASTLFDQINGALAAVSPDAKPGLPGAVLELRADGSVHHHVVLAAAVDARSSLSGYLSVGSNDPREVPTDVQKWVLSASSDPNRADLLTYMSRADDWFNVYKALECVEKIIGGEKALRTAGIVPARCVTLLKHTANSFARHADRTFMPPARPMSLEDARALIGVLARHVFK